MELIQYTRLVGKWLWLLLAAAFVGGGISYILSSGQPPIYTTQATVSIGRYVDDPNPTGNQIYVGMTLVDTYAQLVLTTNVLDATLKQLNLSMTDNALRSLISTSTVVNTSLMNIKVTFTDPVLTADIANALADQLIAQSPTNLTADQQAQVDFAESQIQALQQQITQQQEVLANYTNQLEAATDAATVQHLTDQRATVLSQITATQSTIAQFQTNITSIQQRTNALTVVQPASIPVSPIPSGNSSGILAGAFAGIALAGGFVVMIEYFDNKIRTTETATRLLGVPVLGAIPRIGKKAGGYAERLISELSSISPISEAYRRLRTNLMFMTNNGQKKVYILTSAGPGEGKTVTAANLAVTMALSGMQVLLVDADLRRPRIHEIFGLQNNIGLTTLLLADPDSERDGNDDKPLNRLNQCLQMTSIPRLRVICSGFIPSNPTEVLGSGLMKRWLNTFRSASNVDAIVIDTPPTLLFSDSSVIAGIADADVIMVVDCDNTRRGAAVSAKEQLAQLGIEIKGIVVNRINPRNESDLYGYNYGYGYYYTSKETQSPARRRLLSMFSRGK